MGKSAKSVPWTRSVGLALQLVAIAGALSWGWSVWAGSEGPRGRAAEQVLGVETSLITPAASAQAMITPAVSISARIDPNWLDAVSSRSGIPRAALAAYAGAASVLAEQSPRCHLGWNTLAAIGHIESDDERHGGTVVSDNGYSSVPIIGPKLDGGPFAGIHDSDGGVWDGDTGQLLSLLVEVEAELAQQRSQVLLVARRKPV